MPLVTLEPQTPNLRGRNGALLGLPSLEPPPSLPFPSLPFPLPFPSLPLAFLSLPFAFPSLRCRQDA